MRGLSSTHQVGTQHARLNPSFPHILTPNFRHIISRRDDNIKSANQPFELFDNTGRHSERRKPKPLGQFVAIGLSLSMCNSAEPHIVLVLNLVFVPAGQAPIMMRHNAVFF